MDLGNLSPQAMLKVAVPLLPLLFKTTAGHTLGLSATSSKWDLRQEITVKVLRSFLDRSAPPKSISSTQRGSIRDPGVKGKKWISRYTIPIADDGTKDSLYGAIDALKEGDEDIYRIERTPVEVEWTGYRKDATDKEPEPQIPEDEKYVNLMQEVTSDVVILYLHGGALYLMDPATHRDATTMLAKLTGGRCMSVRYRLAPQNPFPSALLDALVSYLSLLYPPPGAPHTAIPASKIVFAGDSAGGNLSLALLQLILQLNRTEATSKINFQGDEVSVPLPAGLALNSPWCDVTASMPSFQRFAKYDYLPTEWDQERVPKCDIWPTDPPRVDLYAEGSALCHPLISPLAAKDWTGSPPVFFVSGEEILADEVAALASRMASQCVTVEWERYEAMPHCFGMLFMDMPIGRRSFAGWTEFIKNVVDAKPITTKGTYFAAKTLKESSVDPKTLLELIGVKNEDILGMMKKRRDWAIGEFDKRQAAATKDTAPAPVASKL
jgi:acetyl esterase/lipase